MRAHDIMSSPVVTVRPDTHVKEAAALLASHGFTALPVVDEDDQLIGIVTEADLVRERIPHDPRYRMHAASPPEQVPVRPTVGDVMSSPVTVMGPGSDVADLCTALLWMTGTAACRSWMGRGWWASSPGATWFGS